MMEERALSIAHITTMRWVHRYGPELDERVRRHLKATNDSWRVGETYIKVKGQWMYLYRTVDSEGNTIDFYLNKTRDPKTKKRFFKKLLRSFHVSKPRIITVAKNLIYPIATDELKKERKCHYPEKEQESRKPYNWMDTIVLANKPMTGPKGS